MIDFKQAHRDILTLFRSASANLNDGLEELWQAQIRLSTLLERLEKERRIPEDKSFSDNPCSEIPLQELPRTQAIEPAPMNILDMYRRVGGYEEFIEEFIEGFIEAAAEDGIHLRGECP